MLSLEMGEDISIEYDKNSAIFKSDDYTRKKDMHGKAVYERDLIESQTCGLVMEIRFGTYQAYCPTDRCDIDSVGFYAVAKGYQEMPIGPLEDYAVVAGTFIIILN